MNKLHFVILKSEIATDHLRWIDACEEYAAHVRYTVVELTASDWLEQVQNAKPDGLLANPPDLTTAYKTLYDERIRILNQVCGIPVYPSMEELEIYENKKYLSYWLRANNVPHPRTYVFYSREEALQFMEQTPIPVVGKTNIGASGRGVTIIKSKAEGVDYINNMFSGKGMPRSSGPNWRKKGFLGRVIKKLLRPGDFKAKLKEYGHRKSEVQKEYVLFQEFIPHEYEWRCVRIGESYFAHKKIVSGEKASGSLLKGYDNPPLELFDFVKEVTNKRNFLSQSVDLFEGPNGEYLVNELQCIFGQSDPYQMLVDGEPGRYKDIGGSWVFEAGDFNRYESYLLRVEHFCKILNEQKTNIAATLKAR